MIALAAGWLAATLGALLGALIPSPLFWVVVLAGLIGWRWHRARRPS